MRSHISAENTATDKRIYLRRQIQDDLTSVFVQAGQEKPQTATGATRADSEGGLKRGEVAQCFQDALRECSDKRVRMKRDRRLDFNSYLRAARKVAHMCVYGSNSTRRQETFRPDKQLLENRRVNNNSASKLMDMISTHENKRTVVGWRNVEDVALKDGKGRGQSAKMSISHRRSPSGRGVSLQVPQLDLKSVTNSRPITKASVIGRTPGRESSREDGGGAFEAGGQSNFRPGRSMDKTEQGIPPMTLRAQIFVMWKC